MTACRECGIDLPEAARFCPACGTAVAGRTGEERKIVTVLFADLVDSTASGDGRDPEDIRAAIRPQLERIRSTLEQYGGTFEKYVGDAVMAVFGAPLAHEDDPERAVRAALSIRDQLGDAVRVATNTGEAVVAVGATAGTGEGIATGDVVTTTFRIEQAAAGGTVLVGESTYRATRDAIDYCDPRTISAKGKAEPILVYEALAALPEPVREAALPLAPLVGRREELSLILDTIARARRDKTVQLLTVVGPPGIGKSRLVWELQAALEGDPGLVMWRRGRCLPYGDRVTFWALGEIVKGQAGVRETDGARETHAKLHRAVRDLVPDQSEADWVEGHLRPLVGLAGDPDTEEDRAEAFAAWRRFLEALAEWGPLVLTLDDIHWADDGLLDFIDHLADWVIGYPLVLLCTARPELHERRPTWGARPNASTLALAPLQDSEAGQLLAYLLRQSVVPTELRDSLLARAEGNPLYAQEFVRMLIDRGLLRRAGDEWQLTTENVPLPESLQAILASRLDALEHDDKELLRDAAVLGRAFWPRGVAAVGRRTEPEVVERLRDLERREFVRRRSTSALAGQTEYVFNHVLARDVAYAQIPRALRSEKHAAAAHWLEKVAGERQDRVELLAHHLWKAAVLAQAVGRDDRTLAGRARGALREAGDRALSLNSFEAAENYFSAALEIEPDELERPKLLFGYGKSLVHSQGTGAEQLSAARDGFFAMGDRRSAAEAEVLSARLLLMQGRHADAAERFDRALSLVESEDASAAKAVVLTTVAGFRMATDRGAEAIELASEALEIAERLDLRELQLSARATIGTARVSMGDAAGVEDLEESIRIATEAGSPEVVRAYLNLGSVYANLGDVRRARELHARGREAAERFGDPTRLRWFVAERLYELYWSDRWDVACELAGEMLADIREGTPHIAAFDAYLVRGWIRLARGEHGGATKDSERALELGRSFGAPQLLYPALAFSARVALASDDRDTAARLATELLAAWAQVKEKTLPSFWVAELAYVMRALGRGAELESAASNGVPSTRWLDAAKAVAKGDDERARELYAEIGSGPDEALVSSLRRR
jgi:class 3 adenylate cyclase/tetratricopeptide (TPR) repeat protein